MFAPHATESTELIEVWRSVKFLFYQFKFFRGYPELRCRINCYFHDSFSKAEIKVFEYSSIILQTSNFFNTSWRPFLPILILSSADVLIIFSILSARSNGSLRLQMYPFELFSTTSLQPRL